MTTAIREVNIKNNKIPLTRVLVIINDHGGVEKQYCNNNNNDNDNYVGTRGRSIYISYIQVYKK